MRRHADKDLIVDLAADPAERTSFRGVWSGACRVARMLRDQEIAPGSGVALSGANSARWVAAAWGVRLAGCTLTPLDTELSVAERDNILAFLGPRAVIRDPRLNDRFSGRVETVIDLSSLNLAPGEPEFEPEPLGKDQSFAIIFTSGTTSTPKGVMLSEENFLHQVRMLMRFKGLIRPEDRLLDLLPLHHVYPFTATALLPVCVGTTVIYPRTLKGEDIAAACAGESATIMVVVPQVLTGIHKRVFGAVRERPAAARLAFHVLLKLGGLGIGRGWRPGRALFRSVHSRFPALRFAACGGARLEEHVHRDLARLGFRIVEAYGLSETAPVVSLNDRRRPVFGSVGKAAPEVEVSIRKTDPSLEDGEVLVRGPNVMRGYYRNETATREAFEDGWFRTGDLGRLDRDGNLFLTGRSKEVIVLPSGKNIYPDELEKVYSRAGLAEEICISLTRADGEERLTAVVVPSREKLSLKRSARIYDDIKFEIENLARDLPSYQRVTRIVLYPEPFPRTRLGKLKRWEIERSLREILTGDDRNRDSADSGEGPGDELLDFARDQLNLPRTPRDRDSLELDLGLDSLSRLEFLGAFERRFQVSLSEQEAGSVVNLGELRLLLEKKEKSSGATSPAVDIPLEEAVDTGESLFGRAVRRSGWLVLRLFARLLFRARITGLENLPSKGAFILAPNHVSYLDWLVLFPLLPRRVSRGLFTVGIAEIFDLFPFSLVCYRGRVIRTGSLATTARSLIHAEEVLRRGYPLCLFPEGQRSYDAGAEPPKRGMALLAARVGAPVVPVHIRGLARSMSRLHPMLRFASVAIEILPPLDPDLGEKELGERWHALMKERDHLV